LQLYQGVGASYNFLFGRGVPDSFSNLGLKLRPVGIVVPTSIVISIPKLGKFDLGVDASYDLRLYPRRFTAEDFGNPPLVPEGSGWEVVHGFVVGGRLSVKN
jgi:hypothetical protein